MYRYRGFVEIAQFGLEHHRRESGRGKKEVTGFGLLKQGAKVKGNDFGRATCAILWPKTVFRSCLDLFCLSCRFDDQ